MSSSAALEPETEEVVEMLEEREAEWRDQVQRNHGSHWDMPVEVDNLDTERPWTFKTDMDKIYAEINDGKAIQEAFEGIISDHWDGEPDELLRDTLHYLLFHELYHPLEAPFSTEDTPGDSNDSKRIHQAIREGIKQAEPHLSPKEQIGKVKKSKNAVKDFILDNRFAVDNSREDYVRNDIIPTWDMMELEGEGSETTFYTITRFIYGAMYGNEEAAKFFEEKTGEEGVEKAEEALRELLNTQVDLEENPSDYVQDIRSVFDRRDVEQRYNGIENLMSVLSPYIEEGRPERPQDMDESAGGSSSQDVLQDLLDDMDEEEQEDFLDELTDELESEGQSVENSGESDELHLQSMHEFYKRNHPEVNIIGGGKTGEEVSLGTQEEWELKNSKRCTEEQFRRMSPKEKQRKIKKRERTGLPTIVKHDDGTYTVNDFELEENEITDVEFVDEDVKVPDTVDFYIDGSGSMFGQNEYGFDDGSRMDMLHNVFYGFVDALYQASQDQNEECDIRLHTFGNNQVSSEPISVEEYWEGEENGLETLFDPDIDTGGTRPDIEHYEEDGEQTYVVVTDGQVHNDIAEEQAEVMADIGKDKDVVMFEIGGAYNLGGEVQDNPNIEYQSISSQEEMMDKGIEVMLQ